VHRKRGVIVRGGGVLENLGNARTMVLDKTGTLTVGRPAVVEVAAAPGEDPVEVLRLCASVDQVSPHVLAQAITAEARVRNLSLALPHDVTEEPGRGVRANVEGRRVEVGKRRTGVEMDPAWARTVLNRALLDGTAIAWLAVEGRLTGAVLLRDPLRIDAPLPSTPARSRTAPPRDAHR
jgi:cation transport ATPase